MKTPRVKIAYKVTLAVFFLIMINLFAHSVTGEEGEIEILNLANLAIPKSLGKIEERFIGQSPRWVIQIQDVHAHFTAQENIAAICDHLNAVYGIKTTALEGGWSSTSFPKSWAIPSSREKQMLARGLLEDDHITGPAYAALFSQTPINLIGIEDENLYEENRGIYLKHLAMRDEIDQKIVTFAQKVEAGKKTVFNPDLQSFDYALTDFREGKKPENFFPILLALMKIKGIDIPELDQIGLFKQALTAEKSLDKQRLDSEAARLMQAYKRQGLGLEELLRNGKIPAEKLEFYPETKKYMGLMKLQDQISHRAFFGEIEEAIRRLKEKLIVSEEERRLDALSERFLLEKKILLFQATPDDLKKIEAVKVDVETDLKEAGLKEALELGFSFYDVVKKRDDVFFKKIMEDPRLNSGNITLVAGGFHTEGLDRRFEEAGISYIVISPDLAGESANEKLYFERIKENVASSQTFSEAGNRFLTPRSDEAFVKAVESWPGHNNIKTAETIYLSYQIGAPAEDQEPVIADVRDFLSIPLEEQSKQVQKAFDEINDAKTLVWLFVKSSTLNKLIKESSLGNFLWKVIVSNPANKVVILFQEIDEILNIENVERRNVIRLKADDFDRVIAQGQFKNARDQKHIAIIAADYRNKGYLVLEETAVSLLLFRPLVEGGWRFSYQDARTQVIIMELLFQIQNSRIQESAA